MIHAIEQRGSRRALGQVARCVEQREAPGHREQRPVERAPRARFTGPCIGANVIRVANESESLAERRERAAGVDLHWPASSFHLRQVFRNLFQNAAGAATQPLHIEIEREETTFDGGAALRIAVRDSGPGFASEARQHAFEPFYTNRPRGTGLGIAICKRIVEAHRGRIEMGKPGPGGEIIITLPRRPA